MSHRVHQISAVYQTDGNFLSSTAAPVWQVINTGSQQTTTSLLSSSVNPVLFRRALTLLTTVSSASCTPTGTVRFLEGGTVLGAPPLDNSGHALLAYNNLTIGAHVISAIYEGDANCGGSISSTLVQYIILRDRASRAPGAMPHKSRTRQRFFARRVLSEQLV